MLLPALQSFNCTFLSSSRMKCHYAWGGVYGILLYTPAWSLLIKES